MKKLVILFAVMSVLAYSDTYKKENKTIRNSAGTEKKDGKTYVNGSEIITSIETSNGISHVINDVLLPK